jgi:hypothetical protein
MGADLSTKSIFHNPLEIQIARFLISSSRVFLRVLLNSLLHHRCSVRPWSLMPLLHSSPFQHLFLNIPPFQASWCDVIFVLSPTPVSCTVGNLPSGCSHFLPQSTVSMGQNFSEDFSLAPCHCCMTGHLPALHHATVTWQDTFQQAAANFLWDPQSPRVSLFSSPRCPTACFQPLCRFFHCSTVFTMASYLGAS